MNALNPVTLANAGIQAARSGAWETALDYLDQALAIRPKFPEAQSQRCMVLDDGACPPAVTK